MQHILARVYENGEIIMKKIFLTLTFLFSLILPVFSVDNVLPENTCLKYTNTVGLYQASDKIVLHKEPNEESDIVMAIRWNKNSIIPETLDFDDLFVVYMPSRYLALMAVVDETEDWVEVIYNNKTGARGWMKQDDPYKFTTWIMFYNMYGRKYGLKMLKGAPDIIKDLKAQPDDKAQTIARVNIPTKINLTVIRGNWALVSVMDLDKTPKTGYIRWRSDDGVKYLFPNIK